MLLAAAVPTGTRKLTYRVLLLCACFNVDLDRDCDRGTVLPVGGLNAMVVVRGTE